MTQKLTLKIPGGRGCAFELCVMVVSGGTRRGIRSHGVQQHFGRRYGGRWGGVRRSGVRLCSGDARCVGRGQILFGSQCGVRGPSLRNRRQPVLGRYSYLLGEFVRLHRSFKPAKLASGGCYVFCLSVDDARLTSIHARKLYERCAK